MTTHAIRSKEELGQPILVRAYVETVEKADDGSYKLTAAIASDGSKDRMGETINPDGWDLRSFKKNPVLLWGHDYHKLPVGRVVKISMADAKLVFDAEFAPTPEGQDVALLYKDGFLKAFSVGFLPTKFGPSFWLYSFLDESEQASQSKFTYEEQELLEISCVTVPANPKALVEAKSLMTSDALKKDLKTEPVEAPADEPAPAAPPPAADAPAEAPPAPVEGETPPAQAGDAAPETPAAPEPQADAEAPAEEAKGFEAVAEHKWEWTEVDGEAEFLKDPELKAAFKKIRSDFEAQEKRIEELRQELEAKTGQPVSAKEAVKVLNLRIADLSSQQLKGVAKSAGLRLRVLKTHSPDSQREGGDN